jgi:hypothetical protein
MPCEFLIDADRGLVISRGAGNFCRADFLGHMEALSVDPRFRPEFDHMVDGRKFERVDLTPTQIWELRGESVFAATSRRALVVSSRLHFGLGRMFAVFREVTRGQITMVFCDMREAVAWLGLPSDYDPSSLGEPTRIDPV